MDANPHVVTLHVWGPFGIIDPTGHDCAPKGMKERGLLALLALSPDMRRSREWLQDKLWSDRAPEQARTSLRRALANIRKAFAASPGLIEADRWDIWLAPNRWRIATDRPHDSSDFLETLRIRDPEFENWRRDQAAVMDTGRPDAGGFQRLADHLPTYAIGFASPPGSDKEAFAQEQVCTHIQRRLLALGEVAVISQRDDRGPIPDTEAQLVIELHSRQEDDTWIVQLRLLRGPRRACHWSDQLTLPFRLADLVRSPKLMGMLSRMIGAVYDVEAIGPSGAAPPHVQVRKASELLFTGNPEKIEYAQAMLGRIFDHSGTALAGAWLSFGKLTQALEFQDTRPELTELGLELAESALLAKHTNPVVPAIAAIVNMKLNGDFDYGHYLAQKATALGDQNPYSLNAMSQACFFRGEYDQGYRLARLAQICADGLRNSYYWDIQACLAALGAQRVDLALEHARHSYLRWPRCRPPLRYLVALNLLRDDRDAAGFYAQKLRALEPGFSVARFHDPDYPVETLRRLDMHRELNPDDPV